MKFICLILCSLAMLPACALDGLTRSEAAALAAAAWKHHADTVSIPLPALAPLDSAAAFSWSIPSDLEPDATMDFVFGTKGEKPEVGYPLFIYLHGSGPRDREWDTGRRLAAHWEDAPSAYFIPRIPREGEYYRWWQKGKQWVWNRLLRRVLTMPDIDPDRIYVVGISEGGYGSQRLASFLADYLN